MIKQEIMEGILGRVIMVASGKGGTGKTMFSLNFAEMLANEGYKTALIDMNTGLRSLDLAAGVENRSIFDVCDIIKEVSTIDDTIIRPTYNENLGIIPGCQDIDSDKVIRKGIHSLVDMLISKHGYDFVVIDSPPGIGGAIEDIAEASNDIIIVLTPESSSLRDADAMEDYIIRRFAISRYYVLNNVMYDLLDKNLELTPKIIDSRMKSKMLGIVQTDINIRMSMNMGIPVVLKRNSYIANNFKIMINRYINYIKIKDKNKI